METGQEGYLRIGELSQRTGVSPELLRAWERRYGLLKPTRSAGGFRLYTDGDEARVHRMKEHLDLGVAAAEAARLAAQANVAAPPVGTGPSLGSLGAELETSLAGFDGVEAHRVLDRAFDTFSLDLVFSDLLLPYLRELGDRWERGEVSVAQEHFASNLLRARLMGLARTWGAGYGPRALLACPEGELHDLALVLFGIALHDRGWRITFLGADTPLSTVVSTAQDVEPAVVVISSSDPAPLARGRAHLETLAKSHRLILAGPGASELGSMASVELLDSDPVSAADHIAAAVR